MSADEYTPTWFEVREEYAQGDVHREAEFDRMMAANDAEVARAAKAEALEALLSPLSEALSVFVDSIEHCDGGSLYLKPEVFREVIEAEYRKVATDE